MIFTTKFTVFSKQVLATRVNFLFKKKWKKKKKRFLNLTDLCTQQKLSIVNAEVPSTQTSSFIYFARRDYKIVNEIFESMMPRTQTNSLQYLRWAVIIVIKLFYIYL